MNIGTEQPKRTNGIAGAIASLGGGVKGSDGGDGFSALLNAKVAGPTGDGPLEKQARALVAQVFFAPMLKQMQESPFRSDLFEGGEGGKEFGELYNQRILDRMGGAVDKKMVASVVKKLSKGGVKIPARSGVNVDEMRAKLGAGLVG